MQTFDAIVIGSGQAGNPLSQRLAEQSWTVALIERDQLGGTCVNTGCTPTKTMVASAQVAHYARAAQRWGVRTGQVAVDLAAVVARKDRVVQQWRSGQEAKVRERKTLRLYRGHGRFVADHRVQVGDDVLESRHIFIDTGARAAIPSFEGLDGAGYLTNATIMRLTEVPEHLLILGGGYIGLEFGQMFRRFGSRVTIVNRGQRLLAREDPDVAAELQSCLETEGIEFRLAAKARRVAKQEGQIVLHFETPAGPSSVTGSHLLVATGRRPNTDDMGLETTGIRLSREGFIDVNNKLETAVAGVSALGDVKGGPAFTHVSYNDYAIVYANLIEGKERSIQGRLIPYSVFTDPQLGRVGLTEDEARKAGYKLKIGKIPVASVARAIERDETAGLMKIVIDADTDKILGAAILSAEGGELVQSIGIAMLAGVPYTLLKSAIYIHPTLAEGFWTLLQKVEPV